MHESKENQREKMPDSIESQKEKIPETSGKDNGTDTKVESRRDSRRDKRRKSSSKTDTTPKVIDITTKHYAHYFPLYLLLIEVLGVAFICANCFIVAVYVHRGSGLFVHNPYLEHLHMIVAPIVFVFLSAQGLLLFRLMKNVSTQAVKLIHSVVHICVLFGGIFAIFAIWTHKENPYDELTEYQNTPTKLPSPHKYTPITIRSVYHLLTVHSCLGWLTFIIYILELFLGVYLYLFNTSDYYKKAFYGSHKFLGVFSLITATIAAISGLVHLFNDGHYFEFSRYLTFEMEYRVAFLTALCGSMFTWIILYIIINPKFDWVAIGPY